MPNDQAFYRTVPALASYIDRCGAVEKNFRRWMVQENHGHYYREKCVIKIAPDGTITVTDEAYAPTAAEQAAIKLAFAAGIELPRSMEVRPAAIEDLMELLRAEQRRMSIDANGDPDFFEFYSQRTGNLMMVQQRVDTEQGKRYLPWSYWSDGVWRCMEPDGDLPFWKPKQATDMARIMVHEGAKAAHHVTELCADETCTHPWIEELRQYEHWGMIGGALSPHRADYNELWAREPDLVVYVCDNDWPGKAALPVVSKKYKRTMRGIYFDSRFPPHFDLADDMPRSLFTATGRYIGPRLDQLVRNCTWATEQVPPPPGSKARPTLVINPYFIKEWAHVRTPEVYVHVDVARHYMAEREFNSWVNPFSDTDDTAKILRRRDAHKAAGLRYNPNMPSGLIEETRDYNFVNTYVPPIIQPEEGDCAIWEDYLTQLFPAIVDRTEVIRWCATLVCRPDIKMNYGMLLISETQGVGKSTLGSDILKPLVGEWNVSEPGERTVVDSNFNGWCAHKRLAIIHEIYAGNSSKPYDMLKSVITESSLRVNEKYQAEYNIENWIHIVACSNSKRALKLSMDDRRWLVPAVSEHKRPPDDWMRLHNWLANDGGLNKIKWWFGKWLQENGGPVERGVDAPNTTTKRDVVVEGYSPGQALIHSLAERLMEENGQTDFVFADTELPRVITQILYDGRQNDKLERAATLRKVVRNAGLFVSEQPIRTTLWPIERGMRAYVVSNNPSLPDKPFPELHQQFPRPLDVLAKARQYFGAM